MEEIPIISFTFIFDTENNRRNKLYTENINVMLCLRPADNPIQSIYGTDRIIGTVGRLDNLNLNHKTVVSGSTKTWGRGGV